jgi:hypothetical protein
MLNHCTALRVLSVVYTTEKKQEHTGCIDRQEVEGIAMAKKSPNPSDKHPNAPQFRKSFDAFRSARLLAANRNVHLENSDAQSDNGIRPPPA